MIVPFEKEHLKQMRLSESVFGVVDQYRRVTGPAMTLIKNDLVIGAGGVERLWQGVGEAWLILSDDVFGCPITVARYCFRGFPKMIGQFHRVQASVLAEFEKGINLVKMLGFEFEGYMEKYGPNQETYERYVILR